MVQIKRWLLVFAISLHGSYSAALVKFEVNSTQRYDPIKPIWNTLNLWSPSFMVQENGQPNTWHRDTHPFISRVILMTATGGRPDYPQLEIYKLDSLGQPIYDFNNFDSYLEAALHNQFTPIVVLGAIPFALAPDPYHIGVFGSVTDPPTDYTKWHEFVKALITHCVERFGPEKVSQWQWRLYTEPDNHDWWIGTKEEYFKLYDYTVAAAQEAFPQIIFGPGNMLGEIEDHWGIQFIDHACAGTNYFTGQKGSYFKFFTISAYERCVKDFPPLWKFETRVQTIKNKLRSYGALDTIAIGFDEGQLITDENGLYLWLGDGTEYGASWQAAYHILGIRQGFERIVHWGFTSDGVKTPKYNVIEMLEKMKDDLRIDMQMVGDSRTIYQRLHHKIDGIASIAPDESSIKIFLYSHHQYRYPSPQLNADPVSVQMTLNSLPFSTKSVRLTHWLVDSTHSNFFNVWLQDSKDLPRVPYNGIGGSIYDAGVNSNFNQDGHIFWWYHKPKYLQIDDLEKAGPDQVLAVKEDGSLEITIAMRFHAVSLLEIVPDSALGVRMQRADHEPARFRCRIFPNPSNGSLTIYVEGMDATSDVRIFDIRGRLVKSFLKPRDGSKGPVTLKWLGDTNSGTLAPSGVYFVEYFSNGDRISHKLLLLR